MLYYAIAYSMKAKNILVLGSGGGFVPRVFRQAQRDAGLENSKTILVDGNIPVAFFGTPDYLNKTTFFRTAYPEIELIVKKTSEAYNDFMNEEKKFNIIWIDADRTLEGVRKDFNDYKNIIAKGGIIGIHDTCGNLPCYAIVDEIKKSGYNVINFMQDYQGVDFQGVAFVKF